MLDDVAAASEAALRSLGFRVGERRGDTWTLTLPNSRPAVRTLRGDRARITLSDARKRGDQSHGERALLVAPSASPGVLDAARMGRWDLVLWEYPRAIVNGVVYEAIGSGTPMDAPRRRDRADAAQIVPTTPSTPSGAPGPAAPPAPRSPSPPAATVAGAVPDEEAHLRHTGGRPPWTRWAVARLLLLRGPQPVGRLADVLGVSRQAVSRALQQWGAWVSRGHDGAWAPRDPDALRGAWERAYPGPGGETSGWSHPLPPLQQTRAAALVAQREGAWPLVGGDVALWEQGVEVAVASPLASVLVRTAVDLRAAGFQRVLLGEATLVLRVPADPTVWATAIPATVAGEAVVVVDPLIAARG